MRAYTISRLATNAGVSVHVIRDYELRGLIHPCQCMPNGYRIYDEEVLQRLRFVLAGKEAGVSLDALSDLCQAMDNADCNAIEQNLNSIQATLERNLQAIRYFGQSLSHRFRSGNRK